MLCILREDIIKKIHRSHYEFDHLLPYSFDARRELVQELRNKLPSPCDVVNILKVQVDVFEQQVRLSNKHHDVTTWEKIDKVNHRSIHVKSPEKTFDQISSKREERVVKIFGVSDYFLGVLIL